MTLLAPALGDRLQQDRVRLAIFRHGCSYDGPFVVEVFHDESVQAVQIPIKRNSPSRRIPEMSCDTVYREAWARETILQVIPAALSVFGVSDLPFIVYPGRRQATPEVKQSLPFSASIGDENIWPGVTRVFNSGNAAMTIDAVGVSVWRECIECCRSIRIEKEPVSRCRRSSERHHQNLSSVIDAHRLTGVQKHHSLFVPPYSGRTHRVHRLREKNNYGCRSQRAVQDSMIDCCACVCRSR